MRTIKVGDPDVAIDELQAMVGIAAARLSVRRPARPITAKYLQNAATFYLERYPARPKACAACSTAGCARPRWPMRR